MPPRPSFDSSEFWYRKHWYLSNTIKFRSGSILVTEGQYHNPQAPTHSNGKQPKPSSWILIFTKLDDPNQPLSSSQRITGETRLPTGLAISADRWKDFKRAFGRYFMHKESRCQKEVNQYLMLNPSDYQEDRLFEDCDGAYVIKSPIRDSGLLEHSKQRANLIEKAIAQLPAYGMENDDDTDTIPQTPKPIGSNSKAASVRHTHARQDGLDHDDGEDEDDEADDNPKTPDILGDDTVTLFADSDFEDTPPLKGKKGKEDGDWKMITKKKNTPKSSKGEIPKGKAKKIVPKNKNISPTTPQRQREEDAHEDEDDDVVSEDADVIMEASDIGEPEPKKKKMTYAKAVSGSPKPV